MRIGMNRCFIRRRIAALCICALIIFVLLFVCIGALYITGLNDMFPVYAEKYSEYITEKAVSETSEEIFRSNPELHNIQKGDVSFLTSDIQKINNIKSQVNYTVSKKIEESDSKIKIPIGSLSGINVLSGTGPDIPVYAKPIVITTSEFKDEFISAGINQTKYRVYLDINVDITFICAGVEYNKKINDYMLISETIIIGNVPDIYGNTLPKTEQ